MEPADVDWNKVDSRFVWDDLYEHFNAPKWVDFTGNHGDGTTCEGNDEAWFCRPDCRHPKVAEDYLQTSSSTPTTPKVGVLGPHSIDGNDVNQRRHGNLKRRGVLLPAHSTSLSSLASSPTRPSSRAKFPASKKKYREDIENQNPNLNSPVRTRAVNTIAKAAKETVKSSAEKPRKEELVGLGTTPPHQRRRLKSTLSARNLFAGKDILSQISEFCNDIKRLALIGRDRKPERNDEEGEEKDPIASPEKELEPLKEKTGKKLEKDMSSSRCRFPEGAQRSAFLRQKVRSSPPTPQQIPSPIHMQSKFSPIKPLTPMAAERCILQEKKSKDKENELMPQTDDGCSFGAPAGAEAKALDMLWFLKPCTY